MVTAELIRAIREHYSLPWNGRHGLIHWARVLENGLRLAQETGADVQVVSLFAVFHDSQRITEGRDRGHGRRGADLAASLRGEWFDLDQPRFDLLYHACVYHTDGLTAGDITVRTCWDADRLDLGRISVMPDPRHLCTEAARRPETIRWANERSTTNFVPSSLISQWLPEGTEAL